MLKIILLLSMTALSIGAMAKEDRPLFSLKDAINDPGFQHRLIPGIVIQYGNPLIPNRFIHVLKDVNTYDTAHRNKVMEDGQTIRKSDIASCQEALHTFLIEAIYEAEDLNATLIVVHDLDTKDKPSEQALTHFACQVESVRVKVSGRYSVYRLKNTVTVKALDAKKE